MGAMQKRRTWRVGCGSALFRARLARRGAGDRRAAVAAGRLRLSARAALAAAAAHSRRPQHQDQDQRAHQRCGLRCNSDARVTSPDPVARGGTRLAQAVPVTDFGVDPRRMVRGS